MRYVCLMVALLSSACATTTPQLFPVEYVVVDNPEARRIEIAYSNDKDRPVCLPQGGWPTSSGAMDQASGYLELLVGGQRYPISEVNTGYCFEDCDLKVLPGETVRSSIPYEQFGLPVNRHLEEKQLVFQPVAYTCSR